MLIADLTASVDHERATSHPECPKNLFPVEVLGWVKGVQPEPSLILQAFSAICETRRLNNAGYAKFRKRPLYGECGLAGQISLVNIFQDFLSWNMNKKSSRATQWSGSWMSDTMRVYPRFYRHPYQSPQQELWPIGEVEWFVIIRNVPPETREPSGGDAVPLAIFRYRGMKTSVFDIVP